jgi:predicted restriction endonuclease
MKKYKITLSNELWLNILKNNPLEVMENIFSSLNIKGDFSIQFSNKKHGKYIMKIENLENNIIDLILFNSNVSGRNSRFVQLLPYLLVQKNSGNKFFYILNMRSDDRTPKSKLVYEIVNEIEIKMINRKDFFNEERTISSIEDLVFRKKELKKIGKNLSTHIKEVDDEILIYGKSGGAETGELMVISLFCKSKSDKETKIIEHNDGVQNKLTLKQKNMLITKEILIEDKHRTINKLKETAETKDKMNINHRNQELFRQNLIKKYGNSNCLICGKPSGIASHIERQSDINKNKEYTLNEKDYKSVSENNGFFLCRDHDYYFERKIFSFNDLGEVVFKKQLNNEEKKHIPFIVVDKMLLNSSIKTILSMEMKNFLTKHREGFDYQNVNDFLNEN